MQNPLKVPVTASDVTPETQMLRLASGHVAAQAVHVFASLGLADMLSAQPRTADHLASESGADPASLFRVLRYLASIDVVELDDDGLCTLTRLGRTLCSKPTSVIRDNTMLMASPQYWNALGGLVDNVKTGSTAFDRVYGKPFFTQLAEDPAASSIFNAAMNSSSRLGIAAILGAYDFSAASCVVDIAGGKGALLQGILRKHANLRGVLFDAPHVVEQATVDSAVADRFTKVAGSFFDEVPRGGGVYILRRILHDWNDEQALRILRRCREAMQPESKLLVIEAAAPTDLKSGADWLMLDLLMMVLMDGRERTGKDLRDLLGAAGFSVTATKTTRSPYWIIEATPVE